MLPRSSEILTTAIHSVSSPKYVITLILTVLRPITSRCCQILAIIHVLLDGSERKRLLFFQVLAGGGTDVAVGEVSDDV